MNLKLRYYTRLFKAFIVRFNGIIIIGVVIGFIFFLTFNYILPIFINRSYEVIGLQGKYHSDKLPIDVQTIVSDGLTKINFSLDAATSETYKKVRKGGKYENVVKKTKAKK